MVFEELEKRFGLEPYFNESLFERREDGYYCVRIFGHLEALDCMPETKGRTKLSANQTAMSEETKYLLKEFYGDSSAELERNFNLKLSWN
jgi:hypothetical protein